MSLYPECVQGCVTTLEFANDADGIDPFSATPVSGIDRFFIGAGDNGVAGYIGLIDEFQLYNRALTDGEILWLGGGTAPIHKPL